jgi:hypothetical protein
MAANTLIYAEKIQCFKFPVIENQLFSVIHFVLLLVQSILIASKYENG